MDTWSIVKTVNSAAKAFGVSTGALGALVSGPVGFAVGTTLMVKRWVDGEGFKLLEHVRQREGCPHIELIEGSPPTASAVLYVSQQGGLAWCVGDSSSLYFHHPNSRFRPLCFSVAYVQGPAGVKALRSQKEFQQVVLRPPSGYGCDRCRDAASARS